MRVKAFFIGLILAVTFYFGCTSSDQKTNTSIWEEAKEIQFEGENIFLKIPDKFKRSSRYSIENDLTYLQNDSIKLKGLQNFLYSYEFQDAEIDFFVDTTSEFHVLIFVDTKQVPFDKEIGSMLNAHLNEEYSKMEAENPNLDIEKIDSKIKGTDKLQMMKFKHRIGNLLDGSLVNNTVIFVTTPVRTIVMIEISIEDEDIEDYLWSIKEY